MKSLSGILFSGHDELIGEPSSNNDNTWNYTIWEDGIIVEWFVFEPVFKFAEWDLEALETLVVPYLQRKGVGARISEPVARIRRRMILDLIEEHQDIFQGDIERIMPHKRALVSENELREWLTLHTIPALYKLPEILDLPFAGPDFNIYDFSVYLDMQRGLLPSPQDLDYLDLGAGRRTERGPEWAEAVLSFEPVLFTLAKGVGEMTIHVDLGHLFYC